MEPWDLKPARDLGMSPTERLKSLHRESGLVSTFTHFAWWTMIQGYLQIWHRLTIEGKENLPAKPPFILVANHTSHLDACVLASPLPAIYRDRIFPIAAGDVFFHTPLASAFAAFMLNALTMWRKKCGPHALEQLRQRLLEEGCAYILFPEGGRSRDGTMLPFKPGLGMLVAETDVPVVPCYLDGCFAALPAENHLPRPKRIRLSIGKPIAFPETKRCREGWEHIAKEMETRVRELGKA